MTTIEKISAGLPSRPDWAMAALLVIAKLYRGNSRIEAQIMALHNELHIKKYGRPAFGGTSD